MPNVFRPNPNICHFSCLVGPRILGWINRVRYHAASEFVLYRSAVTKHHRKVKFMIAQEHANLSNINDKTVETT